MKSSLTILLVSCLAIFQNTQAQGTDATITIFPDEVILDKTLRPSIAMIIDAEVDAFSKAWRDYLRKTHDLRTRERRGIISANEASFEAISSKTLDFYTVIKNHDVGIRVDVVVGLGYDVFLSQSSFQEEYRKMEQMLNEFSRAYLRAAYTNAIKDKEKAVKSLEKDIAKATKSNEKLRSNIEKDSKEIEKLSKRLESNQAALEEQNIDLPNLEQSLRLKKQRLEELKRNLQKVN